MIERNYTFTISHCSKAVEYGLIWLLGELEKHNLQKGCILAVGKSNFCRKTTEVYKEGLGEAFVKKLCDNGYIDINGRKIELQYPLNMSLSSVGSVLAIYPPKKIVNKIEEEIAHNYRLDRPYLPPIENAFPKSLLIIPWVEFNVDAWIKQYNPNRIDINCIDDYKFGKYRE
jgi:hypothetical protein